MPLNRQVREKFPLSILAWAITGCVAPDIFQSVREDYSK